MKFQALSSTRCRLAQRLLDAFRRRVVWFTDVRRDLSGLPSVSAAFVAILGREHYGERRKAYPLRSRLDLHRVLALELRNSTPTLAIIGPWVNDQREVTFFELRPGALEGAGRAIWLVPESLLIAGSLSPRRVAEVQRDGLRYFLAASGVSQVAGGTLQRADLFAVATGMDPDQPPVGMDRSSLEPRLLPALRKLPASAWLRLFNPGFRPALGIAWRPLGTLAGAGFFIYMLFASGYLSVTESLRMRELETLGPEVADLLDADREIERLAGQQHALARLRGEREATYVLWRIASPAWQRQAVLSAIELADAKVTLRGSAPVATSVLEAIAADPQVNDARFAAPVRQVGDGQQFTITFSLTTPPEAP